MTDDCLEQPEENPKPRRRHAGQSGQSAMVARVLAGLLALGSVGFIALVIWTFFPTENAILDAAKGVVSLVEGASGDSVMARADFIMVLILLALLVTSQGLILLTNWFSRIFAVGLSLILSSQVPPADPGKGSLPWYSYFVAPGVWIMSVTFLHLLPGQPGVD